MTSTRRSAAISSSVGLVLVGIGLAEADGGDQRLVDTRVDERGRGGVGTRLAEGEVLVVGAAMVGVPFDAHRAHVG